MGTQMHTPGPWKTDPGCGDESVLGPDGFMVADCAIFSMRKGAPTVERNRANASLIAAAPELLRVAKRLAHAAGMEPGADRLAAFLIVAEEARAAIAQAEGRTEARSK